MKTFVILLSCMVCCAIAGHHGLSQKLSGKTRYYGQQGASIGGSTPRIIGVGSANKITNFSEQGYAAAGVSERQQFLLDVLLQVQKPLVNQQLIQLGEVLVTDDSSYLSPKDVILQQFLQQASDREIIGRNGVYNPVDLSNIRQLVGLQRFLVLARNYNVFQRNVVYARLYFNPVMFVDALALAIRERPDMQDLVMPPMNEILPQLYYDNYVLSSAQNVDYNQLIDEATRINIKPSLFDIFGLRKIGALFQYGKYAHYNPTQQRYIPQRFGGYAQDYLSSAIHAKIVLTVEERNANELTDDVDLNVAWNNLIIDQLAQTVIEDIQGGQQSGQKYYQGQQGGQQYYQGQGGQKYYQGQQGDHQYYQGQGGQKYYQGQQGGEQYYQGQGGQKYYQGQQGGQQYYQGQGGQKYYQGQQGGQQYYQGQGGQKYYQGQQGGQQYYPYGSYYGEQSGGIKQGLGNFEQLPQVDVDSPRLLHVGRRHRGDSQSAGYSYYANPFYGYINGEYGSSYAIPYGLQGNQEYTSGYYGQGYLYGPQQYQPSQYGYKNQGYYYGPQEYQYGQYGNKDQGYYYGRQQNQGSQYGPYGYKNQGYYYGRQQDQGAQYGDNKYQSGQYYGQKSASYYGKPYGEQSQYGYDQQQYSYGQNQGSQYGYNGQAYSSAYVNPYSGQQYYYKNGEYRYGSQSQGQQQSNRVYPYGSQGIYNKDYDEVIVLERLARDNRNHVEGSQRYQVGQGKQGNYRYTEQYRELEGLREGILGNIGATQKLSYARRGEILFQSIQQLAARLNIQRITESIEGNTAQQLEKQEQYQRAQQEIQQMIKQLRTLIEQVREEAGISADSEETLYVLSGIINGRIILEQQQQLSDSIQRTLQELQQQIQRIAENQVGPMNEMTPLTLLYGNLRNPVTQQAILSLAQLIDEYRQQLQPYTSYQLSSGGDIAVQNVQIEPLVTYTEYVDVDLVNLIDQQLLQSSANNLQQLSQKVVARQQRLNYEPFTIAMDIESQRQQDVSVRILLGPQIDYSGRRVSLTQNHKNFIVLDAFVQQLQSGVNNIQRNSRQFNGYSSDVTTISQIYHYIMTGQQQEQQQQQGNGVIRQLPQNLLLPRGTQASGGLPVQVMVVVTPLTQHDYYLRGENVLAQQISGLGIAGVGVDQLPLGYPLDRQIVDEQRLDVPNIQMVETVIRYDSRTNA